ncbi:MAG: hypothetical protein HEQ16_09320 [Bosea sp.]|nr:hypothetical protein [Bosea sp. (in: a-proteobacteria)]
MEPYAVAVRGRLPYTLTLYQSEDTLELWEGPNAIIFDGWSLRVRDMLTIRIAAVISEIAKLLRWPALVLDGDSPFKDYMTLVAARSGGALTVVSDPPGPKARQVLEALGIEHMLQVVSQIDGCGMIADPQDARDDTLQFERAPRPGDGYRPSLANPPPVSDDDALMDEAPNTDSHIEASLDAIRRGL